MRKRWAVPLAAAGGLIGYATGIERQFFALRRVQAPVLPAGSPDIRVLHISDPHLAPWQRRKRDWISRLAELEPDLVVNTGDNLGHVDAADSVVEAHRELLTIPGVFVFGSNDYYSPAPKNPLSYLRRSARVGTIRHQPGNMPFEYLRQAFTEAGWLDLNNRRGTLTISNVQMTFAGVDDPHLFLDVPDAHGAADADLTIGVSHAPYRRVLDRWHTQGYRLLLSGHTHGGQVCVPGYGALVTNCDLDRSMAKGLHRYPADVQNPSWLHVSAGLGTSPWQPIRFACRPEATLLTLTG